MKILLIFLKFLRNMKDLYNFVLKSPHNHRFFRSIKIIYHIENNNNFRKIYKICAHAKDVAVHIHIPFSRRIDYFYDRPRTIKDVITLFVRQGYMDGIKMLSSNIDIHDCYEEFFAAAACGHCNVVKYFLKNGIDINYVDENGETALTHAIYYQHYVVVKLLITVGGADVRHIDYEGFTHLHNAAFSFVVQDGSITSKIKIIQMLVNAGINVHHKTNMNRTALDIAKKYRCRDDDDTNKIIQLLEKYTL